MAITRAGGHVLGEHGWSVDEVREIESASAPEPAEKDSAPSMDNTKAELLAAAAAAGLDVDESNTKAEILEALEG